MPASGRQLLLHICRRQWRGVGVGWLRADFDGGETSQCSACTYVHEYSVGPGGEPGCLSWRFASCANGLCRGCVSHLALFFFCLSFLIILCISVLPATAPLLCDQLRKRLNYLVCFNKVCSPTDPSVGAVSVNSAQLPQALRLAGTHIAHFVSDTPPPPPTPPRTPPPFPAPLTVLV